MPVVDPEFDHEVEWSDSELTGSPRGPDEVSGVELIGCVLTGLRLTGRIFDRLRLMDVVLDGCDLSGAVVSSGSWTRVQLTNCRMSGVVLSGLQAQDVHVVGCRADEAVLRMSSWKSSAFEATDLRGADVYDAELLGAALRSCDLTGATFSKARLTGAQLQGSRVDGVIGGEAFRGVRISGAQVLPLALSVFDALDIVVDDES
jgi:uncharacterized protein YjbI with pentapeptide repeats